MNQVAGTPSLSDFTTREAKPIISQPVRRSTQRPVKVLWRRVMRRLRGAVSLCVSLAVATGFLAMLIWQLAELLSYFG